MHKSKIKKGDTVQVITGKDKNKTGEVLKVYPANDKAVVLGVNLSKKHTKPSQKSEGGIIQKELPIHVSNISHIDPETKNITKVGYRTLESGKRVRFFKNSGKTFSKEGKT